MRHSARSHAVTLLLAVALTPAQWPGVVGAQDDRSQPTISTVRAGDTVRVWSEVPYFRAAVGEVTALDADTLRLHIVPSRLRMTGNAAIAIPSLSRLQVQDGHHRSVGKAIGGALLGAVVGLVAGAGLGVLAECGGICTDDGEYGGLAGFVIGGGVGALGGTIGGGILGGRERPTWREVTLAPR